jgi:hypothetical protein
MDKINIFYMNIDNDCEHQKQKTQKVGQRIENIDFYMKLVGKSYVFKPEIMMVINSFVIM